MTTLIDRCQKLSAQLEQLDLARRNASVRKLVQERTREWSEGYTKVKLARERASWLSLDDASIPMARSKRDQFRRNATEALERLTAGEDVSSLTKDALWTRLLQSADNAADAIADSARTAWRQFIDVQGTLVLPNDLRSQVSATPTNDQVIAEYRVAHANYAKISAQPLPRAIGDRDALLQAAEQCHALLGRVEHNVPEDVQVFFRSVFSNTATLASLTPGVWEWLREHGHLDRYRVRSAAQ